MNIQEEVLAIASYATELRRYFHMYPELGLEEYKTSAKIKEALDKLGIAWKSAAGTGIIAEIGQGSKVIALRADMDALSIHEHTAVDYISRHPGRMHACGHDAHTASLIGAAAVLKKHEKDLKVRVRFLWQPSEENCRGAKLMCQDGALDGVSEIYGIHIFTDIASGKINIEAGPRMASTDIFKITVNGRAGHAAKPHQCTDATLCAAAMLMNMQTIISREIDPVEPAVLSVGRFESGSQYNIISGEAVMEGTVRSFSPHTSMHIESSMRRIAGSTAEAYNGTASVEYQKSKHPTVMNDTALANRMYAAAQRLFGEARMIKVAPMMLGEDFSIYQEKVPGLFAFVGGGNAEKNCIYPNHHDCFNIDEQAIKDCIMLYVMFAMQA